MVGVMACRKRANGPKPGNSPKKVGDAEIAYCGRFVWWIQFPPVCSFRIQKYWLPSEFTKLIAGAMFHRPRESCGRPKPKLNATPVSYVLEKTLDELSFPRQTRWSDG